METQQNIFLLTYSRQIFPVRFSDLPQNRIKEVERNERNVHGVLFMIFLLEKIAVISGMFYGHVGFLRFLHRLSFLRTQREACFNLLFHKIRRNGWPDG